MEDDEFNFYRILKSEKDAALQALRELFETLWDKKYPGTPWEKNERSVQRFEQNEDEHFQKSLEGLSKIDKRKKTEKRNGHQRKIQDDDWQKYKWDISKFAYALVQSNLFELDETDDAGMPVSEHIVKIKDIRNKTAHSRCSTCDSAYFTKTLKALGDHIKSFELVGLNVSKYLEELQRIKSKEKPVSSNELSKMKIEFERLKSRIKILQKQENHSKELWKLQSKHESEMKRNSKLLQSQNESLSSENKSLSSENKRLSSKNESLKQTHSREMHILFSEKERLSSENKKISSENKSLKQTHSKRNKRLLSENKSQKQSHLRKLQILLSEKERLSSENESLKQTSSKRNKRILSENESQNQSNSRGLQIHLSENERLSTENKRILSENERLSTESKRLSSENKRLSSENERLSTESKRILSENERLSTESKRLSSENKRLSSENESQRQTYENGGHSSNYFTRLLEWLKRIISRAVGSG